MLYINVWGAMRDARESGQKRKKAFDVIVRAMRRRRNLRQDQIEGVIGFRKEMSHNWNALVAESRVQFFHRRRGNQDVVLTL